MLSAADLAFRWRGLEFARARMGAEAATFRSKQEIVFGVGAEERVLEARNFRILRATAHCASATLATPTARASIRSSACARNAGWSRWWSPTSASSTSASSRTRSTRRFPHSLPQTAPCSTCLTITRDGRLAVVELKADEDIHLPLQGLDYWSRVAWHHARGEFPRFGYFPGRELSTDQPLLYLVRLPCTFIPLPTPSALHLSRDRMGIRGH